ncbi:hypothetical protein INT47_002810 [Mucor saturninus]|uniref:Arrestin-like N-terminal domain-containing protein n=1 Tax=Mucor saturninus TaxID=64648 RepID=A0A8H7UW25_9FUNG|nr:hypothetical protein INT47_002810 [Mucor saturninus]
MSKELTIFLENDKSYYPGDMIKGFIKLDLNRSTNVQAIFINFKGTAEVSGEKFVLIDITETVATPTDGKSYTTFKKNRSYAYNFQFQLPTDNPLPSHAKIYKIATIQYLLTATVKQPLMTFGSKLITSEEIRVYDLIDIDLPHYNKPIHMNNDLGFANGSKTTEWNLVVSKSAFVRGRNINLDCNINNFPPMKNSKTIELHVTQIASTQTVYIELSIPKDTPPTVFPTAGKIVGITYTISAELNMKGVRSAIKLKDAYLQSASIVLGTKGCDNIFSAYRESIKGHARTMSNASLTSTHYQNMSTISLASSRSPTPSHFHDGVPNSSNLKPLKRLDEAQTLQYNTPRRSYLTRNNKPDNRISSPIMSSRTRFGYDHQSTNTRDEPQTFDRAHTPLPSIRSPNANTVGYSNPNSRGSILRTTPSVIVETPHEIGPGDIINRGGVVREKTYPVRPYYGKKAMDNDSEKIIRYDSDKVGTYDGDKLLIYDGEKENPPVPHLVRHDTMSTASSSDPSEYHTPISYLIRDTIRE